MNYGGTHESCWLASLAEDDGMTRMQPLMSSAGTEALRPLMQRRPLIGLDAESDLAALLAMMLSVLGIGHG